MTFPFKDYERGQVWTFYSATTEHEQIPIISSRLLEY
jgi:hypothetical protein